MRARFVVLFLPLCATALLLGLSVGQAQQDQAGKPGDGAAAKAAKTKTSVYSELDKAPAKARTRPNPLESDPDAVLAGRTLFERHCTECHGEAAEGGHRGPTLRAREVQNATPGAVFWILTNGVVWHGMPVWSKLPEPQRWQLVSYLKSLGPKPSPTSSTPPKP